jgi:hypothetical protein
MDTLKNGISVVCLVPQRDDFHTKKSDALIDGVKRQVFLKIQNGTSYESD